MPFNPLLGVLFHWLGGLAAGSFYVPYKGVKKWSWETYWLVGGVFSWIVCPGFFAALLTNDFIGVLRAQTSATLGWTYFFGVLWGIGGLTFGLAMRYLGMSLGMGVTLGYCAAFGTLLPPLGKLFFPSIPVAETLREIASTDAGRITLAGVVICLFGIALAALAGLTKERELPAAEKKRAIAEFDFKKGLIVATFSGVMSACFAFALAAGNPIGEAAVLAGTNVIWSGLPKLVVVLLGGFTTNAIWCVTLHLRNGSGGQYFATEARIDDVALTANAGEHAVAVSEKPTTDSQALSRRVPLIRNYLLCALAGAAWYFQFFFYTMGETQMGKYGFASWTLHMASIIIFSTIWGWFFHEWKGSSAKAHRLIATGIVTLILSTLVIGLGTYLKG